MSHLKGSTFHGATLLQYQTDAGVIFCYCLCVMLCVCLCLRGKDSPNADFIPLQCGVLSNATVQFSPKHCYVCTFKLWLPETTTLTFLSRSNTGKNLVSWQELAQTSISSQCAHLCNQAHHLPSFESLGHRKRSSAGLTIKLCTLLCYKHEQQPQSRQCNIRNTSLVILQVHL